MERLQNEALLVEKMQAGSEEAFATLYLHYCPQLYTNLLRMIRDPLLAEEMVQELFTRIWQNRENKGIKENFAGYIYRIGQHLVHDFFRKMHRDRILLERFRSMVSEDYETIEQTLHLRESSVILEKAIEQLPPQQKKVYELVKMKGCTYKKAAEIMGISPLTVKEYLVATKKSIQNYMLSHMDSAFGLLLIVAIHISAH
ncbi:MAG: RNA polymerase sigma factor [Chitinophagales bacterium]